MILQLYPNEILTSKCTNLEFPTIEEAIESYDIMFKNNGIGIAAPQVGLNKRFFWCIKTICINPTILSYNDKIVIVKEGCLSLPNQEFYVKRHLSVSVEYFSYLGKINNSYGKITQTLYNLEAIVFQHEFDHLNGVLINEK